MKEQQKNITYNLLNRVILKNRSTLNLKKIDEKNLVFVLKGQSKPCFISDPIQNGYSFTCSMKGDVNLGYTNGLRPNTQSYNHMEFKKTFVWISNPYASIWAYGLAIKGFDTSPPDNIIHFSMSVRKNNIHTLVSAIWTRCDNVQYENTFKEPLNAVITPVFELYNTQPTTIFNLNIAKSEL